MNKQLRSASIAAMIGVLTLGAVALTGCSSDSDKPAPTAAPKALNGKSPDEQLKIHIQQMQQGQQGQGAQGGGR